MGSGSPGRRSKVVELIDRYDLAGIGANLEDAWLGAGQERVSLRELADKFNRALLVDGLGLQPVDPRTEFHEFLDDALSLVEQGGVPANLGFVLLDVRV